MYREKIDRWFIKHKDEMLEDLAKLISVPSVAGEEKPGAPYGEGPVEALRCAAGIIERLGFEVRNIGNRVIDADLNGNENVLGILAHLDTVAPGDGWSFDPFKATVKDGRIYGRGTSDDKGPAVAAIYAMAAVRDINPEMTKGCRLILGSAEETGREDMRYYLERVAPPPCVFSPDANFPVINVEKGRYVQEFSSSWQSGGKLPRIVSVKGGATPNVIPHIAEAQIEGMDIKTAENYCTVFSEKTGADITAEKTARGVTIRALGAAAHAATPGEGNNAQTALLEMLANIDLPDGGALRAVRGLNELFPHGDTGGAALGISMEDDISGALTLNFGVLELGEMGFSACFDARTPCIADEKGVDRIVADALAARGFYAEEKSMTRSHVTDGDSHFVRTLLRVYEEHTGNRGECLAIGGSTYAHDIEGAVAFGCEFPGVNNRIHGADEFIGVDQLFTCAGIFAQVILDMCE
jgi:succinyl-diaminopimelate desuccinylase